MVFGLFKKKVEQAIESVSSRITERELDDYFLDDALWELQVALIENNVAFEVSQEVCDLAKDRLRGKRVKKKEAEQEIRRALEEVVRKELSIEKKDLLEIVREKARNKEPAVLVFVGFNGSGKTTTIAKIAKLLMDNGFSCVIAAGDTFRAAAIQQLEEHARNLGVPVIKQDYGADPAAVIYDAVNHARSKGINVVLADTAGRNPQDKNLVKELEKIVRVNKPDLVLLVAEAISGNDLIEQARIFASVRVDGVILTKWDVDEKGGAALSICHVLRKPIYYLGTGQGYDDLEEFDPEKEIKSII